MKKFLILGFLLLGACQKGAVQNAVTQAACGVEGILVTQISNSISANLQCSNIDQVNADILAQVQKLNVCNASLPKPQASAKKGEKMKGVLGPFVCPLATSSIMNYLQAKIPSAWNCSGGVVLSALNDQISQACNNNL